MGENGERLAEGTKVFDHAPVTGTWRVLEGPDDVIELMDDGADGIIVGVRDAGATFLSPIFHELAGVVCTNGTPKSHIGIVSREFQVPCIMAAAFVADEPADGTTVTLDCSGAVGVLHG